MDLFSVSMALNSEYIKSFWDTEICYYGTYFKYLSKVTENNNVSDTKEMNALAMAVMTSEIHC